MRSTFSQVTPYKLTWNLLRLTTSPDTLGPLFGTPFGPLCENRFNFDDNQIILFFQSNKKVILTNWIVDFHEKCNSNQSKNIFYNVYKRCHMLYKSEIERITIMLFINPDPHIIHFRTAQTMHKGTLFVKAQIIRIDWRFLRAKQWIIRQL